MPDTLTIDDLHDALADVYDRHTAERDALPEKGDPLVLPPHIAPESWGVTVFSYVQHYRDGSMSYILHPALKQWFDNGPKALETAEPDRHA
jgi:hypothetical protein